MPSVSDVITISSDSDDDVPVMQKQCVEVPNEPDRKPIVPTRPCVSQSAKDTSTSSLVCRINFQKKK